MVEHVFWGAILSATQPTATWQDDHDQDCLEKVQYLTIKQIFLGEGVKESEEQVVQVDVTSKFGKNVQPVAFLRPGTLQHVSVDISFSDQPVTFSLVKGSGPVHLIGNHTYECPRDVPDESDDEWLEEVETAVAPEGEKMEVEAEAGKKDHKKMDTAERDDAASTLESKKRGFGETCSQVEDEEKLKKRKTSPEEKETSPEAKETCTEEKKSISATEMKEKSAEETTEKSTKEKVNSTEEKENEAPAVQ